MWEYWSVDKRGESMVDQLVYYSLVLMLASCNQLGMMKVD